MKKHNKILFIFFLSLLFSQYAPYFDSSKAYKHLVEQCEIGARYPGSDEHIQMKDYLINYLENKVDSLLIDEHLIKHPYKDKKIKLFNILGKFNPEIEERILILAHWDTREIADKDLDVKNLNSPIIGANDGASGISVLMVFAKMFDTYPLENIGLDLLFVDGEDIGRSGDIEHFSIGTKLFSKSIKNDIKFAVCLDMVGDKDPEFKIEQFSFIQAEKQVREIWSLANEMGYSEFTYNIQSPIYDDHRAFFVETGIPSLDIIDFDYPYWHTLEDTPDKCSAETLGIVGNVISEYIYRIDKGMYE